MNINKMLTNGWRSVLYLQAWPVPHPALWEQRVSPLCPHGSHCGSVHPWTAPPSLEEERPFLEVCRTQTLLQLHLQYYWTEWHTWTNLRNKLLERLAVKYIHSLQIPTLLCFMTMYGYDASSFCSLITKMDVHCLSALCLSQQYWHLRGDRDCFGRTWLPCESVRLYGSITHF